jgi:hypothetical protein
MLWERGTLGEDLIPPALGHFQFYLECYFELSTCRSSGFGISYIPVTAIYTYADRFGLGEFFCEVIRSMDILYVKQQSEKDKEKDKKNGKGL